MEWMGWQGKSLFILFQHKYSSVNNPGNYQQDEENKEVNLLNILLEICIAILEMRKIWPLGVYKVLSIISWRIPSRSLSFHTEKSSVVSGSPSGLVLPTHPSGWYCNIHTPVCFIERSWTYWFLPPAVNAAHTGMGLAASPTATPPLPSKLPWGLPCSWHMPCLHFSCSDIKQHTPGGAVATTPWCPASWPSPAVPPQLAKGWRPH